MLRKPVAQTYTPIAPAATEHITYPLFAQQLQVPDNNTTTQFESKSWRPAWLSRWILLSFLLFFLLALAGLEVLNRIDARNNGLSSPNAQLYYLWTYGPTAVLTVVLALWNRVHYRIRQMTPWMSMSKKGPVTAERSILEDYLSPTEPEIWWRSLRNRDWPVAASSLILILLTLLMVVSTGLLSLLPYRFTRNDVQYRTTANFVDNATDISQQLYESSLAGNIYDAIDTLHLPYPVGTTSHSVYQPFELVDHAVPAGAVQHAPVDVLTFDLECEPASLQFLEFYYDWGSVCSEESRAEYAKPVLHQNMSIYTDECALDGYVGPYAHTQDQQTGNFAFWQWSTCSSDTGPYSSAGRLGFGIGQAQQSGDIGPFSDAYGCNETSPRAEINLLRSKQWMCKSSMSIRSGNVSVNSTTFALDGLPTMTFDSTVQPRILDPSTAYILRLYIDQTFVNVNFYGGRSLPIKLMGVDNLDYGGLQAPLVRALRLAPNTTTIEDLLTSDLFANVTTTFYRSALAQMVGLFATSKADAIVQGSLTFDTTRLRVRELPLRVMEGMLAIMSLLLIVIVASIRLKDVVPCDPARIVGIAQILKENRRIRSLFTGTGLIDYDALDKMYSSTLWHTASVPSALSHTSKFTLHQAPNQDTSTPRASHSGALWWRPLIAKPVSRFLIAALVVALVVALKVLLAMSQRYQGLCDISSSGNEHITWSVIPAAIMTVVAMSFRTLGSVYKLFAPYCLLQQGATATRTLLRNFQSMTEYEVLYHAARDRQLAVFLIATATILSSLLTIIVSGIFTSSAVPSPFGVPMAQTSWFAAGGSLDNGTVGDSALIGGLILEANLSYPDWTYHDLVFAGFQMADSEYQPRQTSKITTIHTTLPAIRSALNCTLYDQQAIPNLALDTTGRYIQIRANFPGSSECVGDLDDPAVFGYTTGLRSLGTEFYFGGTTNNSITGCPSLVSIWGYEYLPPNSTNNNVTYAKALSCYETIEQVDVDTTLTYPDLKIDTSNPPRPIESTAKLFSDAPITIPYGQMPLLKLIVANEEAERFWGAIMMSTGFNETDLGNPDMTDAIVSAIKTSHKIVRAQQYHVALRTNDEQSTAAASTIQATVTDYGKFRLIMHSFSTNLLCGLLIAMLLCGGASSWLMSTRKVLPKRPGSIAAMVSLLADSNIYDRVSLWSGDGTDSSKAQFMDDGQTLFKMGLYGNGPVGDRAYTIYATDRMADGGYELKSSGGDDGGNSRESFLSIDGLAKPEQMKGAHTSVQQVGDGFQYDDYEQHRPVVRLVRL